MNQRETGKQRSQNTTNSYNVPENQWKSFGAEGQDYFNRLYEKCKSQKSDFLKNATQGTSSGDLNPIVDQIILAVATQATLQYTEEQQLHTND